MIAPAGPRYLGAGRTLWAKKLLFDDRNQVCAVVQTTSDPPWLYLPAEISDGAPPGRARHRRGHHRGHPARRARLCDADGGSLRAGRAPGRHGGPAPLPRPAGDPPRGAVARRQVGLREPRAAARCARGAASSPCWPPTAMAPASPSGRSRGSSTCRRCRPTCCSRSGSRSSPTSTRSRQRARRAMPRSSRSARGSSSGCGPSCSRCSCAVTPATGVPRAWPRPSAGPCRRRWSSPSCPSRTSMACAPPSGPRRWWPSAAPTSSSSCPPPRACAAVVSSTGRSPAAAPSSGPRGRGSGRASRSSSRPRPGRTASARPATRAPPRTPLGRRR